MLGSGSKTARSMGRTRSRGYSLMDAAMSSRRRGFGEQREASKPKTHDWFKQAFENSQKSARSRENREERNEQTESLRRHSTDRKVVSLLEEIADKLSKLDQGNGGLGNLIAGGALSRLLSKAGIGGGGLKRTANGRWRDPKTGRFASAPPRNRVGRVVDKLGNTKIGRAVSGGVKAVGNSKIGRVVGGAAKALGRSPAGRILGHSGRLLGNIAGKVAVPLAIASSIYSGISGMRNAEDKDHLGRKATLKEKAAVGVVEAVNGALLGIPGYVSKKVFGKTFSSLMIDGVEGIGKTLQEKTSAAIDSVKNMIGTGLGATGKVFGNAFQAMQDFTKEISSAGEELITAVKNRDFGGAAKALGKLGKLLFKAAAAPAVLASKAAVAGGKAVAQGAQVAGGYVADKAIQGGKAVVSATTSFAGKAVGAVKDRYASMRGSLSSAAEAFGLNKNEFAASAGIESNFNAKAKAGTSSASGTFQFIDGTWLAEVGKAIKHPKAPANLKAFAQYYENGKFKGDSAAKKALLDLRFDPNVSAFVGASFAAGNNAQLAKAGIATTGGNGYLAHFLGVGGAKKLLTSDPNATAVSVAGEAAAAANKSIFFHKDGSPKTVKQVAQWAADKVGQATANVVAMNNSLGGKGANDNVQMASNTSSPPPKIAVSTTMAQAKAPTSTGAATSTPTVKPAAANYEHPPLMKPLPEPVYEKPPAPVTQVATNSNDNKQKEQAQQAPAAQRMAGLGGLPSVNDIADRPRIDLQAIATTIYQR